MYKSKILISCLIALLALAACSGKQKESAQIADADYIYVQDDTTWHSNYVGNIDPNRVNGMRIKVRRWGNLAEIFNDSNKNQYAYAERLGINPITCIEETYGAKKPLVKVETCRYYHVDSLSHSLPFLIPNAEQLLRDIGRNFIDSLAGRGADGYRIHVTSLLRTKSSVKKLRRVNINATDSSTHQFGTTFDLSWNHFDCQDTLHTVNGDDLRWLLAEVLDDLRKQGRCMVKYEKKTHCFHITAIK